jgi:hypothetical protein
MQSAVKCSWTARLAIQLSAGCLQLPISLLVLLPGLLLPHMLQQLPVAAAAGLGVLQAIKSTEGSDKRRGFGNEMCSSNPDMQQPLTAAAAGQVILQQQTN